MYKNLNQRGIAGIAIVALVAGGVVLVACGALAFCLNGIRQLAGG